MIKFVPSVSSFVIISALLLSGCSEKTASNVGDEIQTGSLAPRVSKKGVPASYIKTRELAAAYAANPNDTANSLAYAESLGAMDQTNAQVDVLKAISLAHAGDVGLQSKIGKQLLSANRAGEAATVLERAVATGKADWKTYSALGSAYDQQGQYDLARAQYSKALELNPGSLTVQNNLGMSYALQGKLGEAERILRAALAQPGSAAVPNIRQNLALVVGLSGRLDEAKQIASADLPPDQVQANMTYLEQMLMKPNTWSQLSEQNS